MVEEITQFLEDQELVSFLYCNEADLTGDIIVNKIKIMYFDSIVNKLVEILR